MFTKERDEEASRPLADRVDESEEDSESASLEIRRKSKRFSACLPWLGGIVILMATSIGSMQFGAFMASRPENLDASCAKHTAQWSPVLRDVDIKYQWQNFNGSFMHENIYRKEGSPEVDKAWEALGVDYRAGVVSIADGLASGLDTSFVQRNERYGAGFFVNVEGMHHLHCLNLLRKSLYFNYDRYKAMGHHAFANEEHILRLHITHCLDIIRQVLMCNVDTGLLGQVWANAQDPAAFPDFNTRHRCKNFDQVREWADRLQAPPGDEVPGDYLKEPDLERVIPETP